MIYNDIINRKNDSVFDQIRKHFDIRKENLADFVETSFVRNSDNALYIVYQIDKVIKIGRFDKKNSESNETRLKNIYADYPDSNIILLTLKDEYKTQLHWIVAIEIVLTRVYKPLIKSDYIHS